MKLLLVRSGRLAMCFASLVLVTGCYGSDFTATSGAYASAPKDADSVKVSSDHPDPEQYTEVGLVTGTGASFEGALQRLRESAGENGCDVVYILGEAIQSGPGTPGAAYGMSKSHLRAACFKQTREVHAHRSAPPPAPTVTAPSICAPDCRLGFDCVSGRCVSACNPPCAVGETCGGHGANATCAKAPQASASPAPVNGPSPEATKRTP
jgi:hypothetical protein